MITRPAIKAIKRYGLDKCHGAWKLRSRVAEARIRLKMTTNQVAMAASAFQELINLDVAGALLGKSETERKRAINVLRPGSFVLKGQDDDSEIENQSS